MALIAHKSVFLFFRLQTQQVFRWISVSWGIVQTAATQNLSNTNSKSTPFWSFKFWVPFKFFFRWLFSLFCSVLSCYKQDGRSVRPYQKQNLWFDYLKTCVKKIKTHLSTFVFKLEILIYFHKWYSWIYPNLSNLSIMPHSFYFSFSFFLLFFFSLIFSVTLEVTHLISTCLVIILKFLAYVVHLKVKWYLYFFKMYKSLSTLSLWSIISPLLILFYIFHISEDIFYHRSMFTQFLFLPSNLITIALFFILFFSAFNFLLESYTHTHIHTLSMSYFFLKFTFFSLLNDSVLAGYKILDWVLQYFFIVKKSSVSLFVIVVLCVCVSKLSFR